MIVVCDTNIFVRETHLLRKKGGPQLLQLLRAVKGQLFVPEVLKTEYIEQTRIAASEERNRANAAMMNFGTLIGSQGRYPLLDDNAVDQRTLERLRTLESLTLPAPMAEAIFVAAGQRSLQKLRPTSKSDHGFKDCLIWESVLRLPAGSEVHFVSRDSKAFFDGDEFAPELVEEASARSITVVGYKELGPMLQKLQASTPMLDLVPGETLDLVESQAESEASLTVSMASVATAPIPRPETLSEVTEGAAEIAEQKLSKILIDAQKPIGDLDRKVLGYVAYLNGAAKTQLFNLLSQSGVAVEVAKNVADRLVIAGLVRDTGHHYLPNDMAAAELAANAIEPEIIELLSKAP